MASNPQTWPQPGQTANSIGAPNKLLVRWLAGGVVLAGLYLLFQIFWPKVIVNGPPGLYVGKVQMTPVPVVNYDIYSNPVLSGDITVMRADRHRVSLQLASMEEVKFFNPKDVTYFANKPPQTTDDGAVYFTMDSTIGDSPNVLPRQGSRENLEFPASAGYTTIVWKGQYYVVYFATEGEQTPNDVKDPNDVK